MTNVVLLVGLGGFGENVIAEIDRAERMPTAQSIACSLDQLPGLRGQVEAALSSLLRAGERGKAAGEPRLDIILFAALGELEAEVLIGACQELTAIVGGKFAPMFRPGPAHERTAALQVALVTPGLRADVETQTAPPKIAYIRSWRACGCCRR
jgi:hypothetical protein